MTEATVAEAPAARARIAVGALFLTNGAVFANLVPRFPELKAELALSNAAYGLVLAAFPVGAILAGLAAAPVIRRLGSARTAVVGTAVTSTFLLLAGLSPTVGVAALALALLVAGGADAVTDVGQNAHGLLVQRRLGRSVINGLHALWSIGAVIGGGMAAAAIALDAPIGLHLTVTGVLFTAVALAALRWCLPAADDAQTAEQGALETPGDRPHAAARGGLPVPTARTWLTLAALVLIALAGALVEDAGSSWASVYLSGDLGAAASVAASGYVALVGAQFVGRVLGDRAVDRFGQRDVARAGGLLAAVGMGLALAWPTVPGTVAGFAAAGLGVATAVPAAMHAADELPGLRPGTGLTVVSWLMRLGFLGSPPVVGAIADHAGLRVGLLVVPVAGAIVLLLASALQPRGVGG